MYKLEASDLENVTGGSKAAVAIKGVKYGYKALAKGVEIAGVVTAAADLGYRGYQWARGRHE
jgi:hypothetical protein